MREPSAKLIETLPEPGGQLITLCRDKNVFDNRKLAEETLQVDTAIVALGYKANLSPIQAWGLQTIQQRYIKVNRKMESSLPGVHAARDIALIEGPHPLNRIVIGFGQATVAIDYAYATIRPGGKVLRGHSSLMSKQANWPSASPAILNPMMPLSSRTRRSCERPPAPDTERISAGLDGFNPLDDRLLLAANPSLRQLLRACLPAEISVANRALRQSAK